MIYQISMIKVIVIQIQKYHLENKQLMMKMVM